MSESKKLWGGRFRGETDPAFARYNRSFGFDRRLFEADVRGSLAHCESLRAAGVLGDDEAARIRQGLNTLLSQAAERDESFFDDEAAEDVHSFIEARLVELIGDAGRRLHTGRSRNDQVATALRLWLRDEIDRVSESLRSAQAALLDLAESHADAVLPGYTHMQRAQPVLFAHWCLAYFEMFARDRERMAEVRRRVNVSPLGAAALAGTGHAIDRERVARALQFDSVARNSLDAVSDRDFCVEFAAAASLVMAHLSRLSEDLIIYATTEFGFVELGDAVSLGYMNATEMADYLVRRGLPFREAHEAVGRMVLHGIGKGLELHELELEELRQFSPLVSEDVYEALSLERTLSSKSQTGGTSPARVREALAAARSLLADG